MQHIHAHPHTHGTDVPILCTSDMMHMMRFADLIDGTRVVHGRLHPHVYAHGHFQPVIYILGNSAAFLTRSTPVFHRLFLGRNGAKSHTTSNRCFQMVQWFRGISAEAYQVVISIFNPLLTVHTLLPTFCLDFIFHESSLGLTQGSSTKSTSPSSLSFSGDSGNTAFIMHSPCCITFDNSCPLTVLQRGKHVWLYVDSVTTQNFTEKKMFDF